MYSPPELRALTDEALLTRLRALVRQERESLVDVIEHLMEVDRREVAPDRGYSSLFEYCLKTLGYSEGAAFLRIRTARAAAEFPEILVRLRSGRLHLDAVARLYPHLTAQNSQSLLNRADGASKREVVALVAALQSAPAPERDVIVSVPASPPPDATDAGAIESVPAYVLPPPGADTVLLPPLKHRFHFTADGDLLSMVERLRGLLRHKHPGGGLEAIFKEAAATLLEKLERDRRPIGRRPPPVVRRQSGTVARSQRHGSRTVPKAIKRLVWERDGGRCAYVAPANRRCESRDALEYDHIIAWADGGRSDVPENIRLLCRAHNQRLGRKRFGPRPMRPSNGHCP
ncbi:MAG: HNH endonuclease [Elusimicrobia bacterium]|nr:HNH endonuclease [Elusimicrobiota bacterium]